MLVDIVMFRNEDQLGKLYVAAAASLKANGG
jgi:hypothetical protein